MKVVCSSETLELTYQTTQCHIPEEHNMNPANMVSPAHGSNEQ
jgi:hypothetical protein